MPLGNNSYNKGNSNGKKNDFSPTTYSSVKISNFDSGVDPSSVSFSFWKGMLRITITPIKKSADGGYNFDKDNATEVYLTPTRAALFLNYLKLFRKDPNAYVNVGVTAGNSIIYVTNGAEEFDEQDGNGLFLIIKNQIPKSLTSSELHLTRITSVSSTTKAVQISARTMNTQSSLTMISLPTQLLSTLTATAAQLQLQLLTLQDSHSTISSAS